jgi:filamentous hemagglutinin family protein
MTQNWHDWVWHLGLTTLAVGGTLLDSTALAQITPDDTLGAEGSRVRPNATVQGEPADLIEGGAVRDANLFHSFQEFNVEEQQRVYFDNPAGIDNIFSRVTGDNPSNILGTLGVDGVANLFLLNPNGILFGANASLDVQGSFLATTGNGFLFEDNEVFSATNPAAPSLLAVSVPLGVQYGANPPGAITVQGSTLRVDEAQSLILAGGEVLLENASLGVAVLENGQATGVGEGGRIDIGAVAGAGTLELSETNDLLSLRFPEDLARADIRLTDTTTLDVQASTGGDIAITAQNIDILGESNLLAGIAEGLGFLGSQAGDIRLDATEAIRIDQESLLANRTDLNANGSAGDIETTTGTLQVSNGAVLSASTFGQGDAGDVIVNARDRVFFNGGFAFSSVRLGAVGTGGNVEITTGTLQVSNGAQLSASTFGRGDAGDVIINARDRVSINGQSDVSTRVTSDATGTGGDVVITTRALSVTDALGLFAGTSGQGDAGDIIINARDRVSFNNSFISTRVGLDAIGTGGDVVITTRALSVTNGAELLAETSGQGDAGDIIINARDRVSFDGGFALTDVGSNAIGTGGDVVITTEALSVTNGAALFAETFGRGRAGDVIIRSTESTTLADGSILTETLSAGRGGNIEIHTGSLALADAEISASTTEQGNAGNITLAVSDTLTATDSEIRTSASSEVASGGNITIRANTIGLRNNSDIETNVAGAGTGGDIVVTAGAVVAYDDSDILAYALDGRGGDVQFNTDLFLGEGYRPAPEGTDLRSLDGNDQVDVNASGATPGSVSLPDVSFIQNSLSELPQVPVDPDQLLANSCIARSDQRGSFTITGAGGLPSRPGTAVASPFPTGTVQSIPGESEVDASGSGSDEEYRWQPGEPIVEPQGVYQLPNGRLVMSRECSQM